MLVENKLESLRRRADFSELKQLGHKFKVNHFLLVYYRVLNQGKSQYAWSLSKKVGNAVVRNRIKRRCREFFRKQPFTQALQLQLIFLPKDKNFYKNLDFEEQCIALEKVWKIIENKIK